MDDIWKDGWLMDRWKMEMIPDAISYGGNIARVQLLLLLNNFDTSGHLPVAFISYLL